AGPVGSMLASGVAARGATRPARQDRATTSPRSWSTWARADHRNVRPRARVAWFGETSDGSPAVLERLGANVLGLWPHASPARLERGPVGGRRAAGQRAEQRRAEARPRAERMPARRSVRERRRLL